MPEALEALGRFNGGFEAGYGADGVTARAADLVRALLDAEAEVRFVASGTAANALTLAALAAPHEAFLAHRHAHAAADETGAPALYGGGLGVIPLPGVGGRIDPQALARALATPDSAHQQSPAALSLTNATEYGQVYSEAELGALVGAAREAGLKTHLDGARLANASAAGFPVRCLKPLGLDAVVVGGAKAGSTPSEAIVLFDLMLARRFDARLKHAGQLVSKGRHLSAPWIGMLEGGAWERRAAHANRMARRLAALSPFRLAHPVEANAVFVAMDGPALDRLFAEGWRVFRVFDGSVRLMCSWATTEAAVDELAAALRRVA